MAVTVDEQLLEILACPAADHAPLRSGDRQDAEAEALTCTSCGRVYPVRDGIPVLLLDEASTPERPTESESAADADTTGERTGGYAVDGG